MKKIKFNITYDYTQKYLLKKKKPFYRVLDFIKECFKSRNSLTKENHHHDKMFDFIKEQTNIILVPKLSELLFNASKAIDCYEWNIDITIDYSPAVYRMKMILCSNRKDIPKFDICIKENCRYGQHHKDEPDYEGGLYITSLQTFLHTDEENYGYKKNKHHKGASIEFYIDYIKKINKHNVIFVSGFHPLDTKENNIDIISDVSLFLKEIKTNNISPISKYEVSENDSIYHLIRKPQIVFRMKENFEWSLLFEKKSKERIWHDTQSDYYPVIKSKGNYLKAILSSGLCPSYAIDIDDIQDDNVYDFLEFIKILDY